MNTNLIRNILNIIFMVLALAAVLTYFFVSDFKVFIYVCAAAIFTKLIEFFLRFISVGFLKTRFSGFIISSLVIFSPPIA